MKILLTLIGIFVLPSNQDPLPNTIHFSTDLRKTGTVEKGSEPSMTARILPGPSSSGYKDQDYSKNKEWFNFLTSLLQPSTNGYRVPYSGGAVIKYEGPHGSTIVGSIYGEKEKSYYPQQPYHYPRYPREYRYYDYRYPCSLGRHCHIYNRYNQQRPSRY